MSILQNLIKSFTWAMDQESELFEILTEESLKKQRKGAPA